jgi:L-aspartate oxidase
MLPEPKITDWGNNAGENDDPVTLEDSPPLTALRHIMSDHVGVIRDQEGLTRAIRAIANLERQNTRLRFSNILTTAKLMAVAALQRSESRGGHYRSDHPEARAEWKRRTYLTLAEADRIVADVAETEAA